MLISYQIRAARGLLRWSAQELAKRAGVHLTTIQRMERCDGDVRGTVTTLLKIQRTLEAEGVEFLKDSGGSGVRFNVQQTPSAGR